MALEVGELRPYPDWSDPYVYLTYAYSTEGLISRLKRTWAGLATAIDPDYLKQFWAQLDLAWEEDGSGMPDQDGQWATVFDREYPWARNTVARLINPLTNSFFVDNTKIVPGEVLSIWNLAEPGSAARNYAPLAEAAFSMITEVLLTSSSPELTGTCLKDTQGRVYNDGDDKWEGEIRTGRRRVAI